MIKMKAETVKRRKANERPASTPPLSRKRIEEIGLHMQCSLNPVIRKGGKDLLGERRQLGGENPSCGREYRGAFHDSSKKKEKKEGT